MTNGVAPTGSTAAAAAAVANAIKASGAIVTVEPRQFEDILKRCEAPLVVSAEGGVFSRKYYYLAPYRGLVFHTKTETPLSLPRDTELITAKKIWVPS